jgi:hypothetical protein
VAQVLNEQAGRGMQTRIKLEWCVVQDRSAWYCAVHSLVHPNSERGESKEAPSVAGDERAPR